MNFIKEYSGVVALVILAILGIMYVLKPVATPTVAGVDASKYTSFTSLNVITSDAATSTTALGCVQTVATSTATPIRVVYSTIATSSPTYTGTNTIGLVGWQYGNCPI